MNAEILEARTLEAICDKSQKCKECFCNDLCIFLLTRTGQATTCDDFQRRVRKVVDREIGKLLR